MQTSFLLANFNEVFSKSFSYKTITLKNDGTDANESSGPKKFTLPKYDASFFEDFQIEFLFQSQNPKNQMNLFQTSNEGSGIRLEINLVENNFARMSLQYRTYDNQERTIQLNDVFNIGRSNKVSLDLDKNNRLSIFLNDQEIYDRTLLNQGIIYSDVILGSGLSGTRTFVGEMRNVKFDYKVYERVPLPFHFIFWSIILVYALFEIWISNKNRKIIFRLKEWSKNVGSVCLIFTLTFYLHSRKKSTEFFGDDYLSIFFYMGSTPVSMLRESIGPYFRPVSGFLMFVRYLFHDLNLEEWLFWNYILVSIFASLTYFVSLRLLRSKRSSLLLGLVIATSPALYANMTWWASVGAHQLNTLILFLLTLNVVLGIHQSARKNFQIGIFLLVVLLVFSSEMYLGMLLLPSIYVFTSNFFDKQLVRKTVSRKKKKSKKLRNDGSGPRMVQSFSDTQIYTTNFIFILAVILIRYVWKGLPFAVASSSASDYRYNSFSIFEILENVLAYSSAFVNVYLFPFQDIGYSLNALPTDFRKLEFITQAVIVISGVIIMATFFHNFLRKSRGPFKVRGIQSGDEEQISKSNRNLNLLILGVVTAAPGLLVPNYLQLRYLTPLYITIIFLSFMILSKKASTLVAILLILTNLLALRANYGTLSWLF